MVDTWDGMRKMQSGKTFGIKLANVRNSKVHSRTSQDDNVELKLVEISPRKDGALVDEYSSNGQERRDNGKVLLG